MSLFKIEINDRPVIEALNQLAAEAGLLGKWSVVKDKKRQGGKILQDTGCLTFSVGMFSMTAISTTQTRAE